MSACVGVYNEQGELQWTVDLVAVAPGSYRLAEPVNVPKGWMLMPCLPGPLRCKCPVCS